MAMPRIILHYINIINFPLSFYFNKCNDIGISLILTPYSITCISSDNALFGLGCNTFFG